MIQSFGHAYQAFGLNKLMGFVVALLIFSPEPVALEDIADQLGMSKGPISQITRRLMDHKLIRKVWKPGERKHYFEIVPDIFGQAFQNNFELIRSNLQLARQLKASVEKSADPELKTLLHRLQEMEKFYQLMEKYYQKFLDEWDQVKQELT